MRVVTWAKNHKALQAARRDPTFKKEDGTQANKAYIKGFFEAQLEKAVCNYVHTETYAEVAGIEAQFLSFDAIVEKEGGRHNPANIQAAKRRCLKCVEKGISHAKHDEWSGRVNYAFIVDMFSAKKGNDWSKETKGEVAPGVNGGAPAAVSGSGSASGNAGGGKGKPNVGGAPAPASRMPRNRTSLETNMAMATTTKTAYKLIQGQADELLLAMSTDPDYARENKSHEKEFWSRP